MRRSVLAALALFASANAAFSGQWSSGSSRGYEYHDFGSKAEGFSIVCDTDTVRAGSYLKFYLPGNRPSTGPSYSIVIGDVSLKMPSPHDLVLLASSLADAERQRLMDAYQAHSVVTLTNEDERVVQFDLGRNRPDLCF
ncbi:hypothetical protein PhaeoP23_03947 (plasmid) [Phaeobacter piscinae]|uniref:Uncharacterized protein n=1 Tax=Phaeobacter piscinae TaxID=1580596 RepID=A0ABM6PK68_9RHOB|nr:MULTISPECIES: hypothetical protein [Phaeobacter]ATG38100.1 hypothetical protein PhaeoP36_04025 [Phaeobacter piscinae]AUQ88621.1 hypothetical protein PhaeoP42_04026 [Phaeobacter piscinae]AUQ92610.1 hypothetical protein PhaeoP24_04052 [Phaeobacter inhibens]AUR26426.1 hypothetical protein PhaeoP23_03947 [Phaeobacter piscinae]